MLAPLPLTTLPGLRRTTTMQDITHQNFEAELVNASLAQPVLLDIWAPWCGPCKTLGPTLEKLEAAYAGRFKLVKLNADEEPEIAQQLSQMFGVRSIPFCVLFSGGQPVDGFVGALPEAEVKTFLDKHVSSAEEQAAQDDVLEAEELLADGDTDTAIDKLQAALATNPANDTARYDYLRALLSAGRLEEARAAYEPVAGNPVLDARLVAAGHWLAAMEAVPRRPLTGIARRPRSAQTNETSIRDSSSRNCISPRSEFTEAMDELLEILMRDKSWKEELARKNYVAILQVMQNKSPPARAAEAPLADAKLQLSGKMAVAPVDPIADAYRRKLSMTLF